MAWITLPNEVVLSFTGKPLRSQKMNQDLEPLFKEMRCPGCSERFTVFERWREHSNGSHPDEADLQMTGAPEMEDRAASRVILDILMAFQRPEPNPLRRLQKANDAYHATEVWRRAWLAWTRQDKVIRLHKPQYEWLQQLLDRKLPWQNPQEAKQRREEGEEQQTVGSHLFALSEDLVRQALTTLPDRRRPVEEEVPLDDRELARQ